MTNILVLTTSYPRHIRDDAGVFVQKLVEAFSTLGITGSVLVPKDIDLETNDSTKLFQIVRFKYGLFSKGTLAFGAGIMPNIRSCPIKALQIPLFLLTFMLSALRLSKGAQLIQANWIVSGIIAYPVSVLRKIPYIVTLRGEDVNLLKRPILRSVFLPILRAAAAVVVVGESLRDEVIKRTGLPQNQIHVIPNGVEVSILLPDQLLKLPSAPFLVSVGSVIPRKNYSALLKIFHNNSLSDYHLVICGRQEDPSEQSKLFELIHTFHLQERVHLLGSVAPSDIGFVLNSAKGFISSSLFEGRPNAVLEALSLGKPVFISDIPAHRELVTHGENGFLFDPAQTDVSAQEISQLLKNSELLSLITSTAQMRLKDCTWVSSAERYATLINSILQR